MIAEIKKRLAAATPGPWQVLKERDGSVGVIQTSHITRDVWSIPRTQEDVELIAAAPADIAFLLAEVERLKALLHYQKTQGTASIPLYQVDFKVRTKTDNPLIGSVTYRVLASPEDVVEVATAELLRSLRYPEATEIFPYLIKKLGSVPLPDDHNPFLDVTLKDSVLLQVFDFGSPPYKILLGENDASLG
jgi:hypothetical protein